MRTKKRRRLVQITVIIKKGQETKKKISICTLKDVKKEIKNMKEQKID